MIFVETVSQNTLLSFVTMVLKMEKDVMGIAKDLPMDGFVQLLAKELLHVQRYAGT